MCVETIIKGINDSASYVEEGTALHDYLMERVENERCAMNDTPIGPTISNIGQWVYNVRPWCLFAAEQAVSQEQT